MTRGTRSPVTGAALDEVAWRRFGAWLERDHPVLLGMPESYYLKCFILRKLG